jgi:hypothetical protein
MTTIKNYRAATFVSKSRQRNKGGISPLRWLKIQVWGSTAIKTILTDTLRECRAAKSM